MTARVHAVDAREPRLDERLRVRSCIRRSAPSTRTLISIYAGCAIALVPWIAFLAGAQPFDGVAQSYPWVVVGMVVLLAASSVLACALSIRRAPSAVLGVTLVASFAYVGLWFHLIGRARTSSRVVTTGFVVVVVILAVSVRVLVRAMSSRGATVPGPRAGVLFAAVGLAVTLFALHLASVAPETAPVDHLRLLWTGLDTFELIGLASTAWFLHRRSPWVCVSAPFTAAMLMADAWVNVMSSAGLARLAALAMAVVELSLAGLSLVVAVHGVDRLARRQHRRAVT